MRVIEHIISTIAPHECLGCGLEGSLLCAACSQQLPPIPERCYRCLRTNPGSVTCKSCRSSSALYSVTPITTYDGLAKELVQKLKFERARAGATTVAALLAEHLTLPTNTVITHVPTATSRVRERGYDQAALIARQLAAQTGAMYLPLLGRLGQQRQVGKTRLERHQQMQQLFVAVKSQVPSQILLVDDVITTGATLEACAKILKAAGAKRVSAAVFAAA